MYSAPLEWFVFRDRLRRQWRVLLSTPSITPMLRELVGGCDGFADPQSKTIVLDVRRKWADVQGTMFHELAHAASDERDEDDGAFEERAVRFVAMPMYWVLSREPFGLRFPSKPEGYEKFRTWCRRTDRE
jgi:hypothetical protein